MTPTQELTQGLRTQQTSDEFNRLLQREHRLSTGAFEDAALFEQAQRVARCLNSSNMVPDRYRGELNFGNAVIAVDISYRLGLPVLMVMQNLFIIYGTPSWSAQMVIGLINASGLFQEPLGFEFKGKPGEDAWGCRITAITRSGNPCVGPWVDIGIAKAEGWFDRKDKDGRFCSKWRTIPEMMLRYRAAAYFGRTKCPEVMLGLRTKDEVEDIGETITEMTEPLPNTMPNTMPQVKPPLPAAPPAPPAAPAPAPAAPKPKLPAPAAKTAPTPKPPPAKSEPSASAQALNLPSAPVEPQPDPPRDPVTMTPQQALGMFLEDAGVSWDDFRDWLESTGRFKDARSLATIYELPSVFCETLAKDTAAMVKCVRIYGTAAKPG